MIGKVSDDVLMLMASEQPKVQIKSAWKGNIKDQAEILERMARMCDDIEFTASERIYARAGDNKTLQVMHIIEARALKYKSILRSFSHTLILQKFLTPKQKAYAEGIIQHISKEALVELRGFEDIRQHTLEL